MHHPRVRWPRHLRSEPHRQLRRRLPAPLARLLGRASRGHSAVPAAQLLRAQPEQRQRRRRALSDRGSVLQWRGRQGGRHLTTAAAADPAVHGGSAELRGVLPGRRALWHRRPLERADNRPGVRPMLRCHQRLHQPSVGGDDRPGRLHRAARWVQQQRRYARLHDPGPELGHVQDVLSEPRGQRLQRKSGRLPWSQW